MVVLIFIVVYYYHMDTTLFKHTFMSLVVVAVLDIVAIKLHLFWSFSWFDMPVHFMGGFCVALASVWMVSYNSHFKVLYRNIFFISLCGALCVGVAWEIFELYFGITFLSDGILYIRDTGSDLSMDVLGGLFGSWYAFSLLKNKK